MKDTFNTWPQYSMGTRLCPPELRDETWKTLLQEVGKQHNPMWDRGFSKMKDIIQTDYNVIDLRPNAWVLHPVWNKIPEDEFWYLLSKRHFPVNQNLRHPEQTKYVYLRDKFHDTFGHVPYLYNDLYSQLLMEMGDLGVHYKGNARIQQALTRLYWATIEFGMQKGQCFGAGIISSNQETKAALESPVLDFNLGGILNWEFDPYGVQDRYYEVDIMTVLHSLSIIEHKLK